MTAVDFLIHRINSIIGPIELHPINSIELSDALKNARKMEQYQIESAFLEGKMEATRVMQNLFLIDTQKTGEDYYKEKYGFQQMDVSGK